MAVAESIRSELDAVFEARTEAESFYKTLEWLAPDNVLVHTIRCQIDRWAVACDALEKTVRQKAVPLVEDIERVKSR